MKATFSGQFRPATARRPRDGSRYRMAVRLAYPSGPANGVVEITWEYASAWLWCYRISMLRRLFHWQDNARRQAMLRRWWFGKEGR